MRAVEGPANQAQAPPELRAALTAITRHVDDYANRAPTPRRVNVHKLTTKDRETKYRNPGDGTQHPVPG